MMRNNRSWALCSLRLALSSQSNVFGFTATSLQPHIIATQRVDLHVAALVSPVEFPASSAAASSDQGGQDHDASQNNNKKPSAKRNRRRRKNKSLKPLKDLAPGSTLDGIVVDLCPYGAFVKTQYRTKGSHPGCALLHISQIRDERINDIRDVLEVGQVIQGARVISIDHDKKEVGLSLREKRSKRFGLERIKIGEEMEGKVSSITPYGAFVDVGCKVNALVHISRISQEKVQDIRDFMDVGQRVKMHIIQVDHTRKTMAASMLDPIADKFLDRRRKRVLSSHSDGEDANDVDETDKTELQFFEEAIRELEESFREKKTDNRA